MKRAFAGSVHSMVTVRSMGLEVKASRPFFQVSFISQLSDTEPLPGVTVMVLAAGS